MSGDHGFHNHNAPGRHGETAVAGAIASEIPIHPRYSSMNLGDFLEGNSKGKSKGKVLRRFHLNGGVDVAREATPAAIPVPSRTILCWLPVMAFASKAMGVIRNT